MASFAKVAVVAAAVVTSLMPTIASAHDAWFCGGRKNLAFGHQFGDWRTPWHHRTTRADIINQARDVWHDWVWRGPIQYCNSYSISCGYDWSGGFTATYINSSGVSAGFNLAYGGQEAGKHWVNSESTIRSTNDYWSVGARFGPNHWARPVLAVARRWKQGEFGGFYEPKQQVRWDACGDRWNPVGTAWAYDWNGWRKDGRWTASPSEYTFKLFHVTRDRNQI